MGLDVKNTRTRARITSFDVAEKAGVSQSTVSRALAGSPAITSATRAKVEQAASVLGYVIDERAARLRKGETGTLAVVVIGRDHESANDFNPFYYSLLGSVCAAASQRGYETLVSFQSNSDDFFGQYEGRGKADGMVVIGTTQNEAAWKYFRALNQNGVSAAFWGSPYDELEWVRSDNFEGGILAASEFIAQNCRKIVHIGTLNSAQRQFEERYDGFVEAMERAGLQPIFLPVDERVSREEQGRKAVAQLVQGGTQFDAIFAACDAMALGALQQLREEGLRVPDDCSIIGFDGIRAGQYSSPPLTSIEPDFDVAGVMLVDAALQGEGAQKQERRVPVRLLQRGSVKQL